MSENNENFTKIYDIIGIGIGPLNLGLAALTKDIENLSCLFFDKNSNFDWHPGMMIPGAKLQTPFLSDLVTLADPTNQYSFLNYIKQSGRIYQFYIKETFTLLREEYNLYCQWVADQLDNLNWNTKVIDIQFNPKDENYRVSYQSGDRQYHAISKNIVIGIGDTPNNEALQYRLNNENHCHSSIYMEKRQSILDKKNVTVIGSGQSGAEIVLDILRMSDDKLNINWLSRPDYLYSLEYEKLSLELTSSSYIDYFFKLDPAIKKIKLDQQKTLYKGISSHTIDSLYEELYLQSIRNRGIRLDIHLNKQIKDISVDYDNLSISYFDRSNNETNKFKTEYIVFATGYKYRLPDIVEGISNLINFDSDNQIAIKRNYSIDENGSLFMQNGDLHSHGFTSSDLGMGCYRNSMIINEICKKEIYKIENSPVFQSFC